jgi:hypothetical protein
MIDSRINVMIDVHGIMATIQAECREGVNSTEDGCGY